jgi:hypothetical protein
MTDVHGVAKIGVGARGAEGINEKPPHRGGYDQIWKLRF